jgi:ABC-2 type transport system permease protein
MYISLFYTLSAYGVRALVGSLADFLSGAVIPLPFFPKRVLTVVELLPFAAMQNMPLRIYSGSVAGADAYRGIALQAFWLVALAAVGRVAIGRAIKRVVSHGG